MTNRVKGLVISLEEDIREDYVEAIINAVKMIKGVQEVSGSVVNHDDWMNRTRIRFELERKLYFALSDKE